MLMASIAYSRAFPLQISLTFKDDVTFIQLAEERLLHAQNDKLLRVRVEGLLQDDDACLPRNQNVRKTLDILQKNYGLVVDNAPGSLSHLVACIMNRTLHSSFSIEFAGISSVLPPSRLLLRRIAQVVGVRIVVASTRAKTLVFEPSTEPKSLVVIVHLADSFQSISSYGALSCSMTAPTRDHIAQTTKPPPVPLAVEKATYREQRRSIAREKIVFSINDAEESFHSSW